MNNKRYELMSFFELVDAYFEKFKETFPTFVFGNDPEECSEEIIKCLRSEKPYKDTSDKDVKY